MKENNPALTVTEAARAAALSRSALYEAIGKGQLVARKLGRRTVILERELQAFLNNLPKIKPQAGRNS